MVSQFLKCSPHSLVSLCFFFLEYEDACSQKDEDKSNTYFQIKDANGYVLELDYKSDELDYKSDSELPDSRTDKTFQFSPNENKDSQFWYWHQQPNSDYGYIGSKNNIKRVLSIAFSSNFKENGNFTAKRKLERLQFSTSSSFVKI